MKSQFPVKADVIDSHAHCGIQDLSCDQSFEAYLACVKETPIHQVVLFPPVMEIYDRNDPLFEDTREWQARRTRANEYLLTLGREDLKVIPYLFIWNDFRVDQLTPRHKGIKWHRHSNEPMYQYDTDACQKAIAHIRTQGLPVVYEEELHNTRWFVREGAPGVKVIIPHLGGLNGGYEALVSQGLWENPYVYTDTALASGWEISDYIQRYGPERIMFGSDFPFGDPGSELDKIIQLALDPPVLEAVVSGNLKRILPETPCFLDPFSRKTTS